MTTAPDTTAIDAGFEEELEIADCLADRFAQSPACAREVAAENYAAESLVLSLPKEPPEED